MRFAEPLDLLHRQLPRFSRWNRRALGSFDRALNQWIPEESGVVLTIVGGVAGEAEVDINGDGTADSTTVLEEHGVRRKNAARWPPSMTPGEVCGAS